jgi:hypothetical protein
VEVDLLLPPVSLTAPWIAAASWLDTGAPLSVIPFALQSQGLAWQPLPGVRVTWFGISCDLGHIDIWVTDLASSSQRGPLRVLAKFPHRDPPGNPVPILLGLEFLLTHHAALNLPSPPQNGTIQIP